MKKFLSSLLIALSLITLSACGGSKDEEVALNFLSYIEKGDGEQAYKLISISREEQEHDEMAKILKDSLVALAQDTKKLGGFESSEVKEVTDFKEKEGIKLVTVHVKEKNGNEADFLFYIGDYKGENLIYNLDVKDIKEVKK